MHARLRPLLVPALLGAALGACASRGTSTAAESEAAPRQAGASQAGAPQARAPLAVFRTQPLVIVPVQRLRAGDAPGWATAGAEARAQLAALDSAIASEARARGGTGWSFAAEVERAARRNPTALPDPHALAIDELLGKRQPEQLTGPLGSQLRAIVALGGQRYVLVPAELRYARRTDGRGEAVLRVVLVDSRTSRPLWTVEVHSDPADAPSRALLAGVATRFADLISPPDGAPGA